MNGDTTPSIHASAVQVGTRAILIRGPSGSGKSRLAFDLIMAGGARQIPATTLIGDDRIHLLRSGADLLVRGAPALAGLIEIRGLGLRRCDFVKESALGLVIDLAADDADRMPAPKALCTELHGIELPRIPIGVSFSALPIVLAALLTIPSTLSDPQPSHDCRKGFDNHIRPNIATD